MTDYKCSNCGTIYKNAKHYGQVRLYNESGANTFYNSSVETCWCGGGVQEAI